MQGWHRPGCQGTSSWKRRPTCPPYRAWRSLPEAYLQEAWAYYAVACRTFYSCNAQRLNPSTLNFPHYITTRPTNLSPPHHHRNDDLTPTSSVSVRLYPAHPAVLPRRKGNTLDEATAPAHVVASTQRVSFLDRIAPTRNSPAASPRPFDPPLRQPTQAT